MIITMQQLKEKYKEYSDIKGKVSREIKNGTLIPIVKGIYETDKNTSGYKLSQFIYGPSYLSFDYVLYINGVIPEAIYKTYTCATFNKKKIKKYQNNFGMYIYRDVPKEVYSYGINIVNDGKYCYHIATVEKALCDKIYTMSPVRSLKDLKQMLFEDLRIDEEKFKEMNKEEILSIALKYHSNNLNMLAKFIEKGNG